jgi:hypothetical protein
VVGRRFGAAVSGLAVSWARPRPEDALPVKKPPPPEENP